MKKKEAPTKQKKITIKFFVNKAVQPTIEGKTKRYPLYALITYDRKNTMMRCHYGNYYKDLNEIERVHYPGLLAMEERIIRKTIDYEMARRKADFDLKGTSRKYDQYCIGIHVLLENYLKNQLWSALSRLEPFEYAKALNFNDPDVSFNTLYLICKKIYKEFRSLLPKNFEMEVDIHHAFTKVYRASLFQYTFPTIIEWLDNSAVEDYKMKLKDYHYKNQPEVSKSIDFIERIIRTSLEYSNT